MTLFAAWLTAIYGKQKYTKQITSPILPCLLAIKRKAPSWPCFRGERANRLDPSTDQPANKENPMSKFVSRFMNDESGATAIEYGLIVALIAVAIITAVGLIGGKLKTAFETINGKL